MLYVTFYLSKTSQPSIRDFTCVTINRLYFTVACASFRVTFSPEMFNHDTIVLDLGGAPLNIAVDMGTRVVGLTLSGEIQ